MDNRHHRIEAILEAALGLETPSQRTEYLQRACPDPEMRREISSLLEARLKPDPESDMATVRVEPPGLTLNLSSTDLPAASASAGERLGGYRILRSLGKGGMGAVYEAEELESGRRVALKVLGQGLDSPAARQRFRREGLLAASINHPNTVYVFGTGEVDGQAVIAMELVGGGTLQERVQRDGPLPVSDAVDAILQVIAGLEAAAALGVLHRDIKPSNCFVETDGTVKVGDFGLSISSSSGEESKLTKAGAFIGTPAYSPPEQVRGDAFTVQGDLYAVGMTLYYLLVGRTPFEGGDVVRLLAMVLERPVESPGRLRPELPKGLCAVVLRCLEKQPARRYRSYAELRAALLPFSSAASTPATLSLRFVAGLIDWSLLSVASLTPHVFSSAGWDALLHTELYPAQRFLAASLGFLLHLAYYPALEGTWGTTIGKRLCGLWVTGPARGLPGIPRAIMRSLIAVGITGLPAWIHALLLFRSTTGVEPPSWLNSIGGLLLGLLFVTARRANGFAAVHDLLSGTRVVRPSTDAARPGLAGVEERAAATEAAPQFGPYQVLESLGSDGPVEWSLGFDPQLRRRVWIRRQPVGTSAVAPALRNINRVGRLRWLIGRRSATECWDAYEAVPGKPLNELVRDPQPWNRVRFWLLDLAGELSAAARDLTLPSVLDLNRVWVTADGRAKLLDFPPPQRAAETEAKQGAAVAEIGLQPGRFLAQVAVSALRGSAVGPTEDITKPIRVPLPPHARECLAQLQSGLAPGQFVERLKPLMSRLAAVSVRRRLALVAGCLALPILVVLIGLATVMARPALEGAFLNQAFSNAATLSQCLNRLSELKSNPGTLQLKDGERALSAEESSRLREALEIYVAGEFGQAITNPATWRSLSGASVPPEQREQARRLLATRPPPTEIELRRAKELVEPQLEIPKPDGAPTPLSSALMTQMYMGTGGLLGVGAVALLTALLLRGGLVMRILGLAIVMRDGTPASRGRTLWRGLLAWAPALSSPFVFGSLVPLEAPISWQRAAASAVVALMAVGVTIWLALLPGRGLHDRLAGTCLVPRE